MNTSQRPLNAEPVSYTHLWPPRGTNTRAAPLCLWPRGKTPFAAPASWGERAASLRKSGPTAACLSSLRRLHQDRRHSAATQLL